MGVLDIFSKRNKPAPDVFVYDQLPDKLRVQIVHILQDTIPADFRLGDTDGWAWLAKAIAKEHGLLCLPETPSRRPEFCLDCLNYVLKAEPERALDLVEVALRVVENTASRDQYFANTCVSAAKIHGAIEELNQRFLENACGYQYENGWIARVDSKFIHTEVVKSTLTLLNSEGFDGPNSEFMAAHEHYRHGRVEAAIVEACKAFESTMKVICDKRKWQYDTSKATASALIKILIDKGLVPKYSEEQLHAVEKCLLGIATLRNKEAGHGAGSKPREVAEHYVAYALHMAASNIVFLIECHRAK